MRISPFPPGSDPAARRLSDRSTRKTEAFGGKFEHAVDPPDGVLRLGGSAGAGDDGCINQADQTTLSRSGCGFGQQLADQQGESIAALLQAIQQTDVGEIGQSDGGGPACHLAQTTIAQAICQDEAQHIHGALDHTWALEGLGFTGTGLQRLGSTEPLDEPFAVPVQQKIASHPIVESQAIHARKGIF
jgi:hypothetical protein